MTHTVRDAEAAIARHPECLETLCKAADLLIEAGDSRGEDFAACLDGRMGVEPLMRKYPACRYAMFVAAWPLSTRANCTRCDGRGWYRDGHDYNRTTEPCEACGRTGRGKLPLYAEALRLLAACGKVGREGFGYDDPVGREDDADFIALAVPTEWWLSVSIDHTHPGWADPVSERLALLDAYAAADPDARRRWAEETRAMTAPAEVSA